MTLATYDADKLDLLAGRLLDLACEFRTAANALRCEDIETIVIQDRKAMEWLKRLEQWTNIAVQKSEAAIAERRNRQIAK